MWSFCVEGSICVRDSLVGRYPNWVHCVLRFSVYTRSRDLGTYLLIENISDVLKSIMVCVTCHIDK